VPEKIDVLQPNFYLHQLFAANNYSHQSLAGKLANQN
jgi:hypothetical protein